MQHVFFTNSDEQNSFKFRKARKALKQTLSYMALYVYVFSAGQATLFD